MNVEFTITQECIQEDYTIDNTNVMATVDGRVYKVNNPGVIKMASSDVTYHARIKYANEDSFYILEIHRLSVPPHWKWYVPMQSIFPGCMQEVILSMGPEEVDVFVDSVRAGGSVMVAYLNGCMESGILSTIPHLPCIDWGYKDRELAEVVKLMIRVAMNGGIPNYTGRVHNYKAYGADLCVVGNVLCHTRDREVFKQLSNANLELFTCPNAVSGYMAIQENAHYINYSGRISPTSTVPYDKVVLCMPEYIPVRKAVALLRELDNTVPLYILSLDRLGTRRMFSIYTSQSIPSVVKYSTAPVTYMKSTPRITPSMCQWVHSNALGGSYVVMVTSKIDVKVWKKNAPKFSRPSVFPIKKGAYKRRVTIVYVVYDRSLLLPFESVSNMFVHLTMTLSPRRIVAINFPRHNS